MSGLQLSPLKGGKSRRHRKSGGTAMNPMKSTGGKRRSRRRSRRRKSSRRH